MKERLFLIYSKRIKLQNISAKTIYFSKIYFRPESLISSASLKNRKSFLTKWLYLIAIKEINFTKSLRRNFKRWKLINYLTKLSSA